MSILGQIIAARTELQKQMLEPDLLFLGPRQMEELAKAGLLFRPDRIYGMKVESTEIDGIACAQEKSHDR